MIKIPAKGYYSALLTDTLPFETPLTFSNRGLYSFLLKHKVSIRKNEIFFVGDEHIRILLKFIFGIQFYDSDFKNSTKPKRLDQKIPLICQSFRSVPFNFRIAHRDTFRRLSIVHPRNQIIMARFYSENHTLIVHFNNRSDLSIRRPVKKASRIMFKDALHKKLVRSNLAKSIELQKLEYECLGSFFAYEHYSNIYAFFESREYQNCEQKFDFMIQMDLSKCFESIYTHALAWAIFGKQAVKQYFLKKRGAKIASFPDEFDSIMMDCNSGETNGIVIGPEVSRVFAEIILQCVDVRIVGVAEKTWKSDRTRYFLHGRDFKILRYIDDYFVFCESIADFEILKKILHEQLAEFNLRINHEKTKIYPRPIITELTRAKVRIATLFADKFKILDMIADKANVDYVISGRLSATHLSTALKIILKECCVGYSEVNNYVLSIITKMVNRLSANLRNKYDSSVEYEMIVENYLALLQLAFSIYSGSVKASHSIWMARLLSRMTRSIQSSFMSSTFKHQVLSAIFDGLKHQMLKNSQKAYLSIDNCILLSVALILGNRYRLDASFLGELYGVDNGKNSCMFPKELGYFEITSLLAYMQDDPRYDNLRESVVQIADSKINAINDLALDDSECVLLLMDLLSCPYVASARKVQIFKKFNLSRTLIEVLQSKYKRWFTDWSKAFDPEKELAIKRSVNVY